MGGTFSFWLLAARKAGPPAAKEKELRVEI
jgi:hypothetical protein